jgi:bacillithiol system protein YtxJ
MGLFSSNQNSVKWINLTSESQFQELMESSKEKAVAIFKHSTRCNISSMVKMRLEKNWQPDEEIIPVYLDLLAHRNISNAIESFTGIRHESPQMIVFRNGKPIYNASHGSIDADDLGQKIKESQA